MNTYPWTVAIVWFALGFSLMGLFATIMLSR